MHSPATRRQIIQVSLFTAAYLAASAVTTLVRENSEFILYLVTMLVIIAAIFAVHRRIGLGISVLWALSLWGCLHMIGGLVPIPADWPQNTDPGVEGVVYNLWLIPDRLKYDQVIHAYGFAVTTWLCWQALSSRTRSEDGNSLQPTLGLMTLCAAAGMGFGALNEVIEFIATLTLPRTNVGGYQNTGWDLVYNMFGSVLAAILITLCHRKNNRQGEKS